MNTKLCKRCGRVLPLSEFYRNRAKRDSISTYCKECQRKEQANYITNKKQNIMAKLSVKNGDFSNIRFITAAFDLFLARIDGRNETRDVIGKRYIISNANLNKFVDAVIQYFNDKGYTDGGAFSPEDLQYIATIAREYVADEKRRNKVRKATANIEKGIISAINAGMTEDEYLRVCAKFSTIKQQIENQ